MAHPWKVWNAALSLEVPETCYAQESRYAPERLNAYRKEKSDDRTEQWSSHAG